MGVSLKQAEEWEGSLYHNDPAALVYFTTERTKTWETRLEEYYKRREVLMGVEMDADQLLLRYKEKKRIGTEFHGFMSLSLELRDMIYKYLLDKGSVFLPNYLEIGISGIPNTEHAVYDFETRGFYGDYLRYRGLPNWRFRNRSVIRPIGLINGVSRNVHEEATTIYYGCNRFVFPYGPFYLPITSSSSHETDSWQEGMYTPPFALLSYVSFTFDMRNINASDQVEIYQERKEHKELSESSGNDNQESEPLQPSNYLINFHDTMRMDLLESWDTVFDEIRMLVPDRLELSFEECYCPLGCCRLVNEVIKRLRFCVPPAVIEMIGWYDENERERIKEGIKEGLDKFFKKNVDSDVRFVGKSTKELRAEYKASRFPL
ncbi:uncharacterized protein F4817DRAFT_346368 [Daldinia loculata]|uniref:uncharacterized protein n=1 Tax=Daldinia loculata TaxID=103429 RepID=UPI0020C1C30B|nr:uncharacterized protein F4817DRAFT_346368 [Daldinia loculata]KAI1644654.1 hypothetical protein F4817DRAFT_346368 [Daldinia loculata]